MTRALPRDITSYDLVKSAALILMVVDHVGANFYPDEMWFRAVGRMAAPIFLFLVGYARSRDLSPRFWMWAAACEVGLSAMGEGLFPLNILFTIIFCRVAIDPVMRGIGKDGTLLYPLAVLAFILAFPSFFMFEYGTSALLPVMLGGYLRMRDGKAGEVATFALVSAGLYTVFEFILFPRFDPVQGAVAAAGIMGAFLGLTLFRPATFPEVTRQLGMAADAVKICGRRSLEIYVLHVLLLKGMSIAAGTSGMALFNFHIF